MNAQPDRATQPVRLLRLKAVIERTGLSRSTIYDLIKRGEMRPIKISTRSVAFIESEISEWIASRIAATRGRDHSIARGEARRINGSGV